MYLIGIFVDLNLYGAARSIVQAADSKRYMNV